MREILPASARPSIMLLGVILLANVAHFQGNDETASTEAPLWNNLNEQLIRDYTA